MDSTWKTAAGFARQSLKDDDGIEAQFLILAQRATQDQYTIPNAREFRFSENKVSGQAARRRDWERLVGVVESGNAPFDRVYIKARPRFGRWKDPREHMYWELRFAKRGVRIIYCNEESHLDFTNGITTGNIGQVVMNFLESIFASMELAETTKRTHTGARTRLLAGFFPGGMYAYALEKWLVNARRVCPFGKSRRASGFRWSTVITV